MVYLVMKPSFYWHLPHFVTDAHYCTYAESSAYKSGYKHDVSESQSYDSIFRRTGERACIPYSELQSGLYWWFLFDCREELIKWLRRRNILLFRRLSSKESDMSMGRLLLIIPLLLVLLAAGGNSSWNHFCDPILAHIFGIKCPETEPCVTTDGYLTCQSDPLS